MNGMRGMIALGVLVCHATAAFWRQDWWGPFAYSAGIGLMVFFALSGFLLYRPYVAARLDDRPAPKVRDYTRRRLLRILPAYWAALTILAIWPGVPGVFSDHWYAYYGFLQIYRLEWMTGGLPQVWSLCIDVSFYVALPFYAIFMGWLWNRFRSLRIEAAGVSLLILFSLVCRIGVSYGKTPIWMAGTLPGFLVFFGVGMGLAVLSVAMRGGAIPARTAHRIRRAASFGLVAAAGLYFLHVGLFGVPSGLAGWQLPLIGQATTPFENAFTEVTHILLLAIFALCLMLPLVLGETRGQTYRLLTSPTLVGLGAISYGMYLYHVPVLGQIENYAHVNQIDFLGHPVIGTIGCALLFSIPIATLSYRYIELPFLSRKDKAMESGRPAAPARPAEPAPASVPERVPA
jgi:peptidoglycan/LPS O-acetylase OafA/YrhL